MRRDGTAMSTAQPVPPPRHDADADRERAERDLRETLSLLNATFEATADGILVVDLAGHILSFNRKFAELWRIPGSILETKDASQTIAFVLEQLADPQGFLNKVRDLYARPDASSFDVLEFKDGRIFERYSQPQRIGDKSVGRVWSFRDVTERKRSERELERLANHDALTGLMNRRRFEEELARAVAYAGRYRMPSAALVLDLDNFKYFNDTHGHRAGDHLIRSVATVLRGRLRRTDVLARLGGDEFAVVLPQASAAQAEKVALDLLEAIRHHKVLVGGHRISMTVSIGVALLQDASADA